MNHCGAEQSLRQVGVDARSAKRVQNRPTAHKSSQVATIVRIVSMLLAALLGINSSMAGTNAWTSIGPNGGFVFDLQASPVVPQTLYAATSNGFYRSIDAGSSWQQTSFKPTDLRFRPTQLVVDPSNPSGVFVLSNEVQITYSSNNGATLTGVASPTVALTFIRRRLAAAKSDTSLYFVAGLQVYRAADRDFRWERRADIPAASTAEVGDVVVDPTNSSVIYALMYTDGVYRSMDAGLTWQKIFTPVGFSESPWSIAIDPTVPSRIWLGTADLLKVSNNGGGSWQDATVTGGIHHLEVDPHDSSVVYASTLGNRITYTQNGGLTWAIFGPPITGGAARLTIDPLNSEKLYVFGSGHVFSGSKGGVAWTIIDSGLVASSPFGMSATNSPSGRTYLVDATGVAYVDADATRVNYVVGNGLAFIDGQFPPRVTRVLSIGAQKDILLAVLDGKKIARSVDLGDSWTQVATPAGVGLHIGDLIGSHTGPPTIYATTSQGLFRSTDNGDSWAAIGGGWPANAVIDALTIAPADSSKLFVAIQADPNVHKATIYQSSNYGAAWAQVTAPSDTALLSALVSHPKDANTLFAVTDEGIFKTTNGGGMWALQSGWPTQNVTGLAIDAINPDIQYVTLQMRVVRSVDGGATWQLITPTYEDYWSIDNTVTSANKPGQVLITTQGAGVKEITIAPDLELTISSPASVRIVNNPIENTVTVTNKGSYDATGVVIVLQLPDSVNISAVATAATCNVVVRTATCTFGILRNKVSSSIKLTWTPNRTGTQDVTGQVSGEQTDAVTGNNSAINSLTVFAPIPSRVTEDSGGGGGDGALGANLLGLLLAFASIGRRKDLWFCRLRPR